MILTTSEQYEEAAVGLCSQAGTGAVHVFLHSQGPTLWQLSRHMGATHSSEQESRVQAPQ